MQITRYVLSTPKPILSFTAAVVADLHDRPFEAVLPILEAQRPDLILLPGEITEQLTGEPDSAAHPGLGLLSACAAIAPTFYSFGNHETVGSCKNGSRCATDVPKDIREKIAQTGVTLLHNESTLWDGIRICGLASGLTKTENRPNEAALSAFANAEEFRILLCHHPEYYEPYIRQTSIELTVCGHAHGGQWRFFGRGVYAPGQGIFPKYTAGVVDGRCVISRGAGDHTAVPRFSNPRELVIIQCNPKNENQSST